MYRKLDKLAAHGLIKTMMMGQRPYVRSEIGRLIAEAMQNYSEFEQKFRASDLSTSESGKRLQAKVYVDRILDELKAEFRDELIQHKALPGTVPTFQGQIIDQLRFDFIYTNQDPLPLPINNGLGGVQANLQPLLENREGRHYQDGSNFAFETTHWMRMSPYFAFQAQPRFQMQVARFPRDDENKAYVQRLNGHFTYGKIDLEIGRDSVDWGSSPQGGLMFSNNPRPLDMIKLSSISPFYYPFFFKKLGLNEMSLVVANLGPEQNFKNPWLVAYKISNRRTPYLEVGFGQSLILGGEGAPHVGLGRGFVEFFNMTANNVRSARNVAIEVIGRIPQWRGMEIYGEVNFSDFTTNMGTLFREDASYLAGVYLPRLNNTGTLDLRLEYRHLGPRYARSPLFIDGVTENGFLIGDTLGPDSYGITAETFYELNRNNLFSLSFRRHNNIYAFNGTNIDPVAQLGNENRYLTKIAWHRRFNSHFEGRVAMGMEQVQNFNFISADDRTQWLGEVGLIVHFPPYLGVGRAGE